MPHQHQHRCHQVQSALCKISDSRHVLFGAYMLSWMCSPLAARVDRRISPPRLRSVNLLFLLSLSDPFSWLDLREDCPPRVLAGGGPQFISCACEYTLREMKELVLWSGEVWMRSRMRDTLKFGKLN